MRSKKELRVVGVDQPEFTDVERKFTDASANLYAQTVKLGFLEAPKGSSATHQDISVLFEAAQAAAESGKVRPSWVKKYILPVAELWNENDGRAPGSLGGFFGTTFSVTKCESGEYQLSIGGVD